jgi:outer membrane protein assembly factor BamB
MSTAPLTPESKKTMDTHGANAASSVLMRFNWKLLAWAIAIGVGLGVAINFSRWCQGEQARMLYIGLDGMRFYLAAAFAVLVGTVAAVLYFRPSLKLFSVSTVGVFLVGSGISQVIRVDGYYGNRTPRITWIWSPKPEQEIKTYLTSRKADDKLKITNEIFRPTDHDWPELLGVDRMGRVDRISIASDWQSQPPKLLWRHPVGLGWSGFAVVGRAAVNLEQRDEKECVVCYDLQTGTELWCHGEITRFPHEYGDGPRSTPTIRAGRVYSMGATGILTCVDFETGTLIWKQSVFADSTKENLIFGMSGSPVVIQDLVIVTPGVEQGGAAIAFSAKTGDEVWRAGDDEASYASPTATVLCGQTQILSFNGAGLRSYSLDGKELWLQPWVTQGESRVNVAQPLTLGMQDIDEPTGADESGRPWAKVLISSGYDRGTGLLKVTHQETGWKSEVLWESAQLKSKLSNLVVYRNHAYGLDNGIMTCIDLETGERKWKRGRYGHGKILIVRDKLLIQAESGEIVLVQADPSALIELAKFEALTSKTWNNLALSGDIVVVRNDREAAAIQLPVE